MSSPFHPHGVIVPMVTPFNSKSEVDYSALDRLTEFLITNGVHGLMPLGTSGEFALLSQEERVGVIERVVSRTRRRVPVVAGISEPGTRLAAKRAFQAERAGADAVIATGPYYYRTDDEGLLLHYQSILNQTRLPLMVYNIPSYAGYNIPPEVVNKLCEKNPGRIAGVKFTTNDLGLFLEYLRELKTKTQILIGSDSLFFSALGLGAAGGVLGSANVLPEETVSIYNSYTKGDFSRAGNIQGRIDGFTSAMALGTYPSSLKEALRLIGLDCGEVRAPLVPLLPDQKLKIKQSLDWKVKK
ncbi:MAG TPA: dihydrodipicolinate synthase family protein [Nitrososphaerales archaeon]|nr:dihydrodipicolinate synthase family protein [Nitrososphaerales archaeon]